LAANTAYGKDYIGPGPFLIREGERGVIYILWNVCINCQGHPRKPGLIIDLVYILIYAVYKLAASVTP
jgi:hypothetical protein